MKYIIIQKGVRGRYMAEGNSPGNCFKNYRSEMIANAKNDPCILANIPINLSKLSTYYGAQCGEPCMLSEVNADFELYYKP